MSGRVERSSGARAVARKAVELVAHLVGEGVKPDNICIAAANRRCTGLVVIKAIDSRRLVMILNGKSV